MSRNLLLIAIAIGPSDLRAGATGSALALPEQFVEQAAVCVAQFTKQPNYAQKLKEFEEASNWTRPEFIEKGGWDKMPGQDKASSDVARACAAGVELLVKK